jgi:PBSX family phage terminase large subunit
MTMSYSATYRLYSPRQATLDLAGALTEARKRNLDLLGSLEQRIEVFKTDFTPYGEVRNALACRDHEWILSGPRDTGKTLGCLNYIHWVAYTYPNASIVICRKRQTDTYSTVIKTFRNKVLNNDMPVVCYGGEKPQWFDYPNGSRIWVTGLDKRSKVLSSEHDVIYVNQAEEIALPDWEYLSTSATGRAGNVDHPQCIGDCNPGHPSHWIQRRRRLSLLKMFEATHYDNPEIYDPVTGELTNEGKQRLDVLKNLSGHRKQRLYLGLWAAPEGAIYATFDRKKHKVVHFDPPSQWPRIVGVDPFGAYIAAVWLAYDSASKVLNVYREYLEPFGVTTTKHAENIRKLSRGETIFQWAGGGPSERQQRVDFAAAGLPLQAPPITDVWSGIDRVNSLIREDALRVHDNCENLLSEIESYHRAMKDGKPTDKIKDKNDFHLLDALRYAVALLTGPKTEEEVINATAQVGPMWH